MSHWQLLTITTHYVHADGAEGEHVTTADTQQTRSVATAMAQLIFSPAVWAIDFGADDITVHLTSVDREGVSGAFLVRATVAGTERHLVYSRRRGAALTAELPTGPILFTTDQMFTASPQVFFTVCSTLDRGFGAELPDGWRWVDVPAAEAPAATDSQAQRLRAS